MFSSRLAVLSRNRSLPEGKNDIKEKSDVTGFYISEDINRAHPLVASSLQGVLCASVRCRCPMVELNNAWSQISAHCPLLLVSAVVLSVLHTAS